MKIMLCLGDWSDDGHGKTSEFIVESSFTKKHIEDAYKAGVKLLGVDVSNEICRDYEDSSISDEHLTIFLNAGLDFTLIEVDGWEATQHIRDSQYELIPGEYKDLQDRIDAAHENDRAPLYEKLERMENRMWLEQFLSGTKTDRQPLCLQQEGFLQLFLFTVKKGDPTFEYFILDFPVLNIGGYGLFN